MARLAEGMSNVDGPTQKNLNMAVLDVQFMKLPGCRCAASYFFITSHTAEHPMARSDQDSVRAAGVAISLNVENGVKEIGSQAAAAYILLHKVWPIKAFAYHFQNHSAGNVVSLSYHVMDERALAA
eukprot:1139522-Pelagomonas_calceolata.AAC.4